MGNMLRLLLRGMLVSVVCLAQQRPATSAPAEVIEISNREAREGDGRRTHFSFEKRGELISRPARMPKPGPYYTTLVKMDQVDRFPYAYALYFSTDHDRGKLPNHSPRSGQYVERALPEKRKKKRVHHRCHHHSGANGRP